MANLLQLGMGKIRRSGSGRNSLQSPSRSVSISSIDDLFLTMQQFAYNGINYPLFQQTYKKEEINNMMVEGKDANFSFDYMSGVYKNNGVVFANMLIRMGVISETQLKWLEETERGSRLFGNRALLPLEKPYPGGTTATLLTRIMQDADLMGNSYNIYHEGEIVRLAPQWTFIVLEPRIIQNTIVGYKKSGYLYFQDGPHSEFEPAFFSYDKVAHFAPIPDPNNSWIGMSWLTPIIREVKGDIATTEHKLNFFRNGATPNMVVRMDPEFISSIPDLKEFYEEFDQKYTGVSNAYKTMYLAGAADVEVVGSSFEQMSFKTVQGAGETRICMAAGTPPVLVGASEGLQAATYSNYAQARRRFADGTLHPIWRDIAGSLDPIIPRPSRLQKGNVKLWFTTDIPFLREDEKDKSEILKNKATVIRTLTDSGYEPEGNVAFAENGDYGKLKHTGLYSVQLWPPGHEEIADGEGAGGKEQQTEAYGGEDDPNDPND